MDYKIVNVTLEEKDKLFRLLQYALYDGSQYINNEINSDCIFEYECSIDDYFNDKERSAYFIKHNDEYLGIVMINDNLIFNKAGKSVAEFLILPKYRRNHIGKKVAYDVFEMFKGDWEVRPMENNPIAYSFWKNVINEYTKGEYIIKNDGVEDVFIFSNGGN